MAAAWGRDKTPVTQDDATRLLDAVDQAERTVLATAEDPEQERLVMKLAAIVRQAVRDAVSNPG